MFPEDIENALRVAGVRDSVALETKPGRIEVVVLAPVGRLPAEDAVPGEGSAEPATPGPDDPLRAEIAASIKEANRSLGPNQRIEGWRLWPEADFPRTHTFKIKRDQVRTWAAVEEQAPAAAHG